VLFQSPFLKGKIGSGHPVTNLGGENETESKKRRATELQSRVKVQTLKEGNRDSHQITHNDGKGRESWSGGRVLVLTA